MSAYTGEQFVIGVDVGGTNTDTAVLHEGNVSVNPKSNIMS